MDNDVDNEMATRATQGLDLVLPRTSSAIPFFGW